VATATAFALTPGGLPTATATSLPPQNGSATPTSPPGAASPTPSPTASAIPTFAPTPTVPPGARRYEDNSSSVSYSAGWTQVLDQGSSAGHHRRSAQAGATASFSVTGAGGSVAWAALRGPTGGRADVALDGVFITTIDLYAPQVERGFISTFAVPPNNHSLRITVRGDANPAATGSEVTVDFFDVAEVVGGRGFSIQRESNGFLDRVVALWQAGAAQDGYLMGRMSSDGTELLPAGGQPLAASTTSYVDPVVAVNGVSCYLLLPVAGSPPTVIANSDLLCTLGGTRAGLATTAIAVRLDQTNLARVSWTVPAALASQAPAFTLVVLGGNTPELIPVPAGALQITHDTGGALRCYGVIVMAGGAPIGLSDVVCAIPGLARL
jgi:hypothetical protein